MPSAMPSWFNKKGMNFNWKLEPNIPFLIVIFILIVIGVIIEQWQSAKKPPTEMDAKILELSLIKSDRWHRYLVVFEGVDAKTVLEFKVKFQEANAFHQGDTGILLYKEKDFIGFYPYDIP